MSEGVWLPHRPCKRSGCNTLTKEGYCNKHIGDVPQNKSTHEKRRGTSNSRGYDYRWQKVRVSYLKRHPLCVCDDCKKRMIPLPANVVDHIKAHKGDKDLFWDQGNWQAMNKRCHDRKTARETKIRK